ncbi:MAG: hypothetical protein HY298_23725 [Verrucomicrobia bacterium]|nr:hypothetical protein [Verrucomicrobiota bacterium]
MRYAVMQKSLEPPTAEQLQRAFSRVNGLTAADAHILGKDAFGILVKNFSDESAAALQSALAAECVETEIAPETALPTLPPAKFVMRAECGPDALMIYDPAGHTFPVEWPYVMLVAAGCVRLDEFKQVRKERMVPRQGVWSEYGEQYEKVVEYESKEQLNDHLLVEIVLSRAVLRYSITADRFNFDYLGERRSTNLPENFALLVQDLVKGAPHAAVNRGAYYLREKSDQIFSYPSRNAFVEEITWLLWQLAKTRPA